MKETLKQMLLYAWQFPQNVCGVIAMNIYRPAKVYALDNGVEVYYSKRLDGGISFGRYVIVASYYWRQTVEDSLKRDTVRHNAIGHTKQSRILGWFYLPVMLVSLCITKFNKKNKYKWGMERWADKIAGVTR